MRQQTETTMTVSRSTLLSLLAGFVIVATAGALFLSASSEPAAPPPSASSSASDRAASPVERASSSALGTDEPAPDFELDRMNGDTFHLDAHRGEVVVVNFWATWCPPCREEIPGFVKLQKEYGDDGLTIVGVSMDDGGFSTVRPFADKMDINYPLVMDDGKVGRAYGPVRALPSTFVVGPDGMIQHVRSGYLPEAQLRAWVKPLLDRAQG
jgi:cytochrome c biogenesis protein CcmG/thiol:disulfide interchange protein DsbE